MGNRCIKERSHARAATEEDARAHEGPQFPPPQPLSLRAVNPLVSPLVTNAASTNVTSDSVAFVSVAGTLPSAIDFESPPPSLHVASSRLDDLESMVTVSFRAHAVLLGEWSDPSDDDNDGVEKDGRSSEASSIASALRVDDRVPVSVVSLCDPKSGEYKGQLARRKRYRKRIS